MATFDSHGPVNGRDFETLTIAGTAIGLTASKYKRLETNGEGVTRGRFAFITSETADVRYTYDGTTPTASVGHLMPAGSTLLLEGFDQISKARFIRTGSTSATFQVSYFNV